MSPVNGGAASVRFQIVLLEPISLWVTIQSPHDWVSLVEFSSSRVSPKNKASSCPVVFARYGTSSDTAPAAKANKFTRSVS